MAGNLHAFDLATLNRLRRIKFAEPACCEIAHLSRAVLELGEEADIRLREVY